MGAEDPCLVRNNLFRRSAQGRGAGGVSVRSGANFFLLGSLHESALSVRHRGRSMNGLRAGMSAPPLMAAARVAAGVTSLTCQEPRFTGPHPNRRSRPEAAIPLPYSITSSARERIDGGTVRPSA